MGRRNRLRLLEVRVAGHHDAGRLAGLRGERLDQGDDLTAQGPDRVLPPEAESGRRLVVAGAPRVELASHGADRLGQEAFDHRVDVFVGEGLRSRRRFEQPGHPLEPCVDLGGLAGREDPGPLETAGPGPASAHILPPKAPIHVEGAVERLHLPGESALETPAPEGMAGSIPR